MDDERLLFTFDDLSSRAGAWFNNADRSLRKLMPASCGKAVDDLYDFVQKITVSFLCETSAAVKQCAEYLSVSIDTEGWETTLDLCRSESELARTVETGMATARVWIANTLETFSSSTVAEKRDVRLKFIAFVVNLLQVLLKDAKYVNERCSDFAKVVEWPGDDKLKKTNVKPTESSAACDVNKPCNCDAVFSSTPVDHDAYMLRTCPLCYNIPKSSTKPRTDVEGKKRKRSVDGDRNHSLVSTKDSCPSDAAAQHEQTSLSATSLAQLTEEPQGEGPLNVPTKTSERLREKGKKRLLNKNKSKSKTNSKAKNDKKGKLKSKSKLSKQ